MKTEKMKESFIRKRRQLMNTIEESNVICKFPKNMLMELTNMCNDSCLFCANSKCTRKKGMIEPELAERVLREAYDLGTREVGFYQTGEPLLNKNLEQYISLAKNLGYEYIYMTTNGALLTEERARSIVEAGIDSIKFSINASNAEDYFLIHGKNEFDRVIQNIIYLDSLRKDGEKKKFSLYISYVATRYTEADKDSFQSKYQQYVDDIVFVNCVNTGGTMKNEIDRYLSVSSDTGDHQKPGACPMIFNRLHITCEGYLTMCCVDYQNYLVVADLNHESLKDAWNNSYACDLRKRHLENDLKGTICHNCMNNCIDHIEPLRKEYAAEFDVIKWDKSEEVSKRIRDWSEHFKV